MPISDAFAQIERQPNICDVVHVNVKYFDEEPLNLDFVISFPDHGFHLHFDPWSHRLRLIEIYDVKRLQLRCATSLIGGPSTLPLLRLFMHSSDQPSLGYMTKIGEFIRYSTQVYPLHSLFLVNIQICSPMEKWQISPWSSQMEQPLSLVVFQYMIAQLIARLGLIIDGQSSHTCISCTQYGGGAREGTMSFWFISNVSSFLISLKLKTFLMFHNPSNPDYPV